MAYLLIVIFFLSLFLTWGLKLYALAKNIIDVPNHRSSHVKITPRGGGLAFIVVFLLAVPFLGYFGFITLPTSILFGSCLLIVALGLVDDFRGLSASTRLIGHFIASSSALYLLGGMPSLNILGWSMPASIYLNVLVVFYLVWLINLYNFMDGIDGIAAVEAITVSISAAILYLLDNNYALIGLPLVLSFAVAGFLYWNFPGARIFMGDSGSGFLGLFFGVLSIKSAWFDQNLFWAFLILLGVFVVDATVTLFSRLFFGMKLSEAHKDHAYQHAATKISSHINVTLSVLIINVFWLLPLSILVVLGYLDGFFSLIVAYLPLIVLALRFKAGRNGKSTNKVVEYFPS